MTVVPPGHPRRSIDSTSVGQPDVLSGSAEIQELLESVECGEWKSASGGKRKRARYSRSRYAKATFRMDRRLNIRLSSKDLEAIQKRALAEGLR